MLRPIHPVYPLPLTKRDAADYLYIVWFEVPDE
jgi:hypothetical protein